MSTITAQELQARFIPASGLRSAQTPLLTIASPAVVPKKIMH